MAARTGLVTYIINHVIFSASEKESTEGNAFMDRKGIKGT